MFQTRLSYRIRLQLITIVYLLISVGRAGRFGTKGIAISFVSTDADKEVMEKVRKQFVVKLPELPDELDCSTYMS